MQEGMLHLGQNLAEELEHLLPHAWRVLRVRGQSACQSGGEATPPPGPLLPSLRGGAFSASLPPSLLATGLLYAAKPASCFFPFSFWPHMRDLSCDQRSNRAPCIRSAES